MYAYKEEIKGKRRSERAKGPLLVVKPSFLLASCKFFFFFFHKQNTYLHTLNMQAPLGFEYLA
jgi:hypothetical protein